MSYVARNKALSLNQTRVENLTHYIIQDDAVFQIERSESHSTDKERSRQDYLHFLFDSARRRLQISKKQVR